MISISRSRLFNCVLSISLMVLAVFSSGCGSESTPLTPATPGLLISSDLIKTFESSDFEKVRTSELDDFFDMATKSASDYRSGLVSTYKKVALYRVAYESVIPELGNQKVIGYGLVAIPEGATNGTPIVSYQHGTAFGKEEAPSNIDLSMETKLALLQFASQGYIVVAADYFGNGPLSTVPNTYFVKASIEQAMFDMHTAAMTFLKKKSIAPGKLFLLGWSQGGYNTLLHFRMLEKNNVPIAGVATASALTDPLRVVIRAMFVRRSFDAVYSTPVATNMIFAFEHYYQLANCSKLFIRQDSNRYETAKNFYSFKATFSDYLSVGGNSMDSICTPEFFSTAKATSHRFWELLSQAESYRWLSQAPLRQYYSDRDEAVPADIGRLAVDYQAAIGKTNGTSHDAGPNADHRCVYVHTLVDVKPWFDSLK